MIYRELPFVEGDIFSVSTMRQGIANLHNLQYFSSIEPETPPGSAEGLMDLIINVEEGRTTDIHFGANFSGGTTGFPVEGFLEWTDKNFLGQGQEFSIGTTISASRQSLKFGFKENWLLGQRWSGGIDLSVDHSLASNVQQDVLPPIFTETDENRVPDPYNGYFVYADNGNYPDDHGNPVTETGSELAGLIESGDAITDYAYAVSKNEGIDGSYLMDYDSINLSFGLSTGYTYHSPIGRLGAGTRISTTLSYVTYEQGVYRPFEANIRNNWQAMQPITKWLINLTWDTRDFVYNPQNGFYIKQSATFTGGFLPSTRHFIYTNTKLQGFLTLFDIPVVDWFSLKGVLAANSALSFVWDPFNFNYPSPGEGETALFSGQFGATAQDLLFINGMMIARGWPQVYNGRALWDSWIELRMPIVEQYIWLDWFLSGTGMWSKTFADLSPNEFLLSDFRFSFGGGIRLTIPGFPIGLYLVKRFKFEETDGAYQAAWQGGNIFLVEDDETSGLDFVISFTADIF